MSLKQNDEIYDHLMDTPSQLDRIEANQQTIIQQNAEILALLTKPKQVRTPTRRKEYHPEFESLWQQYPKRSGSNDKYKAESAWINRVKEADDKKAVMAEMEFGVQRYCQWADATGNTGTSYVMQASRFLGHSKEYLNDWEVTSKELTFKDDDELVRHYTALGHAPKVAESMSAYKARMRTV